MIAHVMMIVVRKKHDHTMNEQQTIISFSLLLKHMGVFIFVLIHFLSHVHISLLCVINYLL
jgi:hypothetical protein